MIKSDIYEKKIKFDENSKIIIGIGDSFCAGSGSESLETWDRCEWDIYKIRRDIGGILEAYDNSFIDVMKRKYLNDYTTVNLSMAGKGNRFAIRELFCNPQLNLENAGEKIVIFVSSGLERFDFTYDIIDKYEHTNTIWPFHEDPKEVGYGNITVNGNPIYTDALIVGEFLMDMYMLMNWCTLNNAKLLFISGFTPILDRKNLINILLKDRNINNTEKNTLDFITKNACELVNKIPWHLQIKPMGYDTMIDLMLHNQGRDDLIGNYHFRNYFVDKHTEDDYVSVCQHPTRKGHELIADIVIKYIENYEDLEPLNFSLIDEKLFNTTKLI